MLNTVKFVDQGTYGCIYKPNIPCANEKPKPKTKSQLYISKVQEKKTNSEREEKIGKIITERIANYNRRYAPIISSCDINVRAIPREEAQKCKLITDIKEAEAEVQFKSYKMKFAGKQSLGKYLTKTASKGPKKLIKKTLESHIYLLESIDKLLSLTPPIIHYDLKDNNIMYDSGIGKPILIDFGLSFELKDIEAKYDHSIAQDMYYVFYEKYPPWCIELVLLSYIVQEVVDKTPQRILTKITAQDVQDMQKICNNFINNSEVFNLEDSTTDFSQEEIRALRESLYAYIASYLDKSWEVMYKDLQKGFASWDNYSIAVIFYYYIVDIMKPDKGFAKSDILLNQYIGLLKKIILAPLSQRPTAKETIAELKKFSKIQPKKEYDKFLSDMDTILKQKMASNAIVIDVNKRILSQESHVNR